MKKHPIYAMSMAKIYPLYIQKVEKKGRTKEEVDQVIMWLTGYDEKGLMQQLEKEVSIEEFFASAPKMNPRASEIKGLICGIRVEDIEEPLMQKIRWLDKLVDELAKGKAMEKILR